MGDAQVGRQRVLVTGANGFVGKALCEHLLDEGILVTALTRTPSDFPVRAGLSVLRSPSLDDPKADWCAALQGVDSVVHTAARVHMMNPNEQDMAAFLSVNTEGTQRLANACVQAGVKRFVFLSTIKVNGEFTLAGQPFRASDPVAPTDPYALSKLKAERILQAMADQRVLETIIVRAPLVYGPGAKGNLERLESLVRRGTPLPLGMLKSNRRSLVSLDNLTSLLLRCVTFRHAANQTFLVSDNEDVSTLQLATYIAKAIEVPLRVWPLPPSLLVAGAAMLGKRHEALRLTQSLQVDVSRTCERLQWKPLQSVQEGMQLAFRTGSRGTH
jgi:nucleoside-diphosphate-sugar epimerase